MFYVPDHPVIRNMERTGYASGRTPKPCTRNTCPVCKSAAHTFYKTDDDVIAGCNRCVCVLDAGEAEEYI